MEHFEANEEALGDHYLMVELGLGQFMRCRL